MKKILIVFLFGIIVIISGCQSIKKYKYIVYAIDPLYAENMQNGILPEYNMNFLNEFSIPLSKEQLAVLTKESEEIYPYYILSSIDPALYVNGQLIEDYVLPALYLFPYFNASDLNKMTHKYTGPIDNEKQYIYLSESLAQFTVSKSSSSEADIKDLQDFLKNNFDDEVSIKMTINVPNESYIEKIFFTFNNENYGPFDSLNSIDTQIQREFYIKGITSRKTKYFESGGPMAYIDYQILKTLYDENASAGSMIVISSSKKIENTFNNLGLIYRSLDER